MDVGAAVAGHNAKVNVATAGDFMAECHIRSSAIVTFMRPTGSKGVATMSTATYVDASHVGERTRVKALAYWACTGVIAFVFISGGLAYAMAVPDVVQGVMQLGFPLYFIQLLGVWKVLGGLAALAPGLPRLKEWAYFGMFVDLTSASVASAVMGASIGAEWWHMLAPLVIAAILVASWALRPASRRLAGPLL